MREVVALTVDCGGDAAAIPRIVSALEEADAPATFFLTGRWVEAFPSESRRIAARYPLGNHTYTHPHVTSLSDADVRSEIQRAADAIRSVTGASTEPLFRFPYGERDERTRRLVAALGYRSVYWTVDTLGWKGRTGGRSVDTVVARVMDALAPGAIVLMHAGAAQDGSTLDADALPEILRRVRAAGYEPVALDAYL